MYKLDCEAPCEKTLHPYLDWFTRSSINELIDPST